MRGDKQVQLDNLAARMQHELDTELAALRREQSQHFVFGEGNPNATVVFVGEAPGRQEARTGKPFIGAAGKLLDSLLDEIGLARDTVYITNVVKDRPPGNRKPRVGEIKAYKPYLWRQLEIIKPGVIVPLGLVSSQVLLEEYADQAAASKMGDLHGRILDCKVDWGNVRILPMYHPAASFYGALTREDLLRDFQILSSTLNQ